jgi:hypothetical protein
MSNMVLVGRRTQKDPIPTTVGHPFNWEDRLEEYLPEATSAPPSHVGTATLKSTVSAEDTLSVVEATFVLADGSEVKAAGTLTVVNGRIHHGSLMIDGAGSGRFANSKGDIRVDRVNPKRYSIPL